MNGVRIPVRVARIAEEAEGIRSYELVSVGGDELPSFEAGAHVDLVIPGGFVRPYSLVNPPWERNRYVIGVQREEAGRGGSKALFDSVSVGDRLEISAPRNNFRLSAGAAYSVLIAGGIGITPLLAMAVELERLGQGFELHVCSRSAERTPFKAELARFGARVRFHHDGGEPSRGLDVRTLLATRRDGAHVYCCGPAPLMDAVRKAAAGWPADAVHFEAFNVAPVEGDSAFVVRVRSSGEEIEVPAEMSILDALRENGVWVASDCEAGTCGTCMTGLLEGEAEHRDQVLTPEEKAANKRIALCCSRARSKLLVLDL